MNTNRFLKFSSALLLAIVLLALTASTAGAQTDPPPDDMFSPVTSIIRDLAESGIRFMVFLSAFIFIASVVLGAARGSIGTAIGNQMQATSGVMTAIGAVLALIVFLLSVPIANRIVDTLTENLMAEVGGSLAGSVASAAAIPEGGNGGGGGGDVELNRVFEIPALQEVIINFFTSLIRGAIALGTIAFVVAVALGGLDTQIGTLMGGGMMASRGIMRIIAATVAVIFLFISYPLSRVILDTVVPQILSNGVQVPIPDTGSLFLLKGLLF
jgi:hypothetical protein